MDQKLCLKFQHELADNLCIEYNSTSSVIAFWNKYEIYVINEKDLLKYRTEQCLLIHYTDFLIKNLLLSNNHLLCLDSDGNLFSYSIKLKSNKQTKRPRIDFQLVEQDILSIDRKEDYLFSIKLVNKECCLRIDQIHSELQLHCQTVLLNKDFQHLINASNRDNCILYCYILDKIDLGAVTGVFNKYIPVDGKPIIIIISFDKLTLYALLIDLKSQQHSSSPIKLLTCPSEINYISVVKEDILNLIICLSAGTVIKWPLNNDAIEPKVAHLNTAIHRFIAFDYKIIYTDGITMWITRNTFSKCEMKLRQFFVMHTKDFVKIDNKIICTTYSKVVYIFYLNNESSYVVPITTTEYCSSEHLFDNIQYLHRIMDEVKKNDQVIINIKEEENYITTMALSNRPDIMSDIVQCNIIVYENYEDILKEGLLLHLTNNVKEYFDTNSYCFLIKIVTTLSLQHNSCDVVTNVFNHLKIHITIFGDQKVVKTLFVNVREQLKTLNIVVPLNTKKINLTDVSMNVKIVKVVPKVFNSKQNLLTTLYSKQIAIRPEQFIKSGHITNNCIQLLKTPVDSVEDILYRTACKNNEHLTRITETSHDLLVWSFYVKLPNTYKELLQNNQFYINHFNTNKAKYLLKEITSDEFLNARKKLSFYIANDKIDIEITADEFPNLLNNNRIKVSSVNPLLALGIRNFFSSLIHDNFQNNLCGWNYIRNSIFLSIEELESAVSKCINQNATLTVEEFFKIYREYQIKIHEILM